jgi:hypothetical protein
MVIFLSLSFALSLLVLLGAAAMERSAIIGRVNGANGLVMLVALISSALASVVVAIIAAWLSGWTILCAVLAGSALYHWVMAKTLIGGLQALATRVVASDQANRR